MSSERDTDPHGTNMAGELFAWACVLLAVFVVGSCIAGGG